MPEQRGTLVLQHAADAWYDSGDADVPDDLAARIVAAIRNAPRATLSTHTRNTETNQKSRPNGETR